MSPARVTYSGLVLAAVGFLLTRFTIVFAAMDDPAVFLFAGLVPLVLGLSLSAFGVVLTVGGYDAASVRTVVAWSVLGTAAMGVLVVLTALGSRPATPMTLEALRAETYFSTFLIGGAVGGTLTGLYAARSRRQRRTLRQRANRLTVLNRLLRDQVINAATAIGGHAELLGERYDDSSVETVRRKAGDIVEVIEDVKYLSHTEGSTGVTLGNQDLRVLVDGALEAVRAEYPDAEVRVSYPEEPVTVRAHEQFSEAFRNLVKNAVEHGSAGAQSANGTTAGSGGAGVAVSVTAAGRSATIRVSDAGPGLPADQQALLEEGRIAEFDDPTTGFGLNIVRLLVESVDGTVRVEDGDGTTVAVDLPRADPDAGTTGRNGQWAVPEITGARLGVTVVAGLAAGVAMGTALQATNGLVPVIGALYGIQNPTVGWVTHLFHSVVFALAYVGALSAGPWEYTATFLERAGLGVAFGLGLWVLAAGVVMPAWLRLVGVPAPLPNLPPGSLLAHAVWGLTAATLYHAGDRLLGDRDALLLGTGLTP